MTPAPASSPIPWSGPRRWWAGPLDVEGLALESVGAAGLALQRLCGRPAVSTTSARVAAAFDSFGHLRIDGVRPVGFAPLSGFHRTVDGWLRVHANYPHHAAALRAACGVRSADDVPAALADLTAVEAERRILTHGGVAAAVRTREAWLAETGPASPAAPALASTVGPRWSPRARASAPLRGLRVLDLTRVLAGPVASRLLAAWGADVLRLEPPGLPELPEIQVDTGPGKRSAFADLTDPVARQRVHELLQSADVLLTGYRPGSLDRFGLGADQVGEDHPQVVVGSLDAWGTTPGWAGRRGFDSVVQAAVGISDRYRGTDGRPGALPVQALDQATGYDLAAAVLTRLAEGGGRTRLSLAGTADRLFALPVPADDPQTLPAPPTVTTDSAFGRLEHVLTPVELDGVVPGYPHPPHRSGSDDPSWTT